MHVDPEIAHLSRTLDPVVLGGRIKTARIAAGLTQGELAGEHASTAYVSRIEAGTRRPTLPLLARLAERAGSSLEELLLGAPRNLLQELELELDHAELELVGGNPSAALTKLEDADSRIEQVAFGRLRRRATRLRAQALEATGQLETAILLLEEITATPRADADWLQELIALSRCYRESGDFRRAIETGERARPVIEELGLSGLTEAIQLTVTVAGAYAQAGDLTYAKRICLRALAAAEAYDSDVARASAYWNASLIEARRGATAPALDLAKRALVSFERGEDARNLCRLRIEVGRMQLHADPPDPDAALAVLQRAQEDLVWTSASTVDHADLMLVRARAHLLQGAADQAAAEAAESSRLAGGVAPLVEAESHAVIGQAAALSGEIDAATASYRRALQVLMSVRADHEAAQLWFELGALLDSVGETDEARDAYRRAAASTGLTASSVRPVTVR